MYIALTLHLLWTLGAAAVITRRQRIPASAAAWLALVFLLPVAGTLLYVLAGYRRAVPAAESCDCRGDAVEQIVARGCGTRPAPRNSVSLLHNGSNAFTALIAALQHAVRSIHMEYYIIRDDRIGRTIAEILIRKARAGLEVRVIYDAVGSWRLSRTTLRRMHDAGVRTAAFEPVRFPWFTTRVSRRNHRKIVVTDGRVAFLGGINIAKYYLDGDYMGKWRDEHLRIEGDAVKDLQRLFIDDHQFGVQESVVVAVEFDSGVEQVRDVGVGHEVRERRVAARRDHHFDPDAAPRRKAQRVEDQRRGQEVG